MLELRESETDRFHNAFKQIVRVHFDQGHFVFSAQSTFRSVALLLPLKRFRAAEELHWARVLSALVLDRDVPPAEHYVERLWCEPPGSYLVVQLLTRERVPQLIQQTYLGDQALSDAGEARGFSRAVL